MHIYVRSKKTYRVSWKGPGGRVPLHGKISCPVHDLTGWVQNEWDGTVTMEIQGRETLINKLLVGLNHDRFITIEWMDTTEIPLRDDERSFSVR